MGFHMAIEKKIKVIDVYGFHIGHIPIASELGDQGCQVAPLSRFQSS